jgi:hypothetical protein
LQLCSVVSGSQTAHRRGPSIIHALRGERGRNRTFNLVIKSLFRVFSAFGCFVYSVYKNL